MVWGMRVLASLAGTRSASSLPFHLMRNMSSPEESVAPTILSGSRRRSNPLGLSSPIFLGFLVVDVSSAPALRLLSPGLLLSDPFKLINQISTVQVVPWLPSVILVPKASPFEQVLRLSIPPNSLVNHLLHSKFFLHVSHDDPLQSRSDSLVEVNQAIKAW